MAFPRNWSDPRKKPGLGPLPSWVYAVFALYVTIEIGMLFVYAFEYVSSVKRLTRGFQWEYLGGVLMWAFAMLMLFALFTIEQFTERRVRDQVERHRRYPWMRPENEGLDPMSVDPKGYVAYLAEAQERDRQSL